MMRFFDRYHLNCYSSFGTPLLPQSQAGVSDSGQSGGCSAFLHKGDAKMYKYEGADNDWYVCRACQKFVLEVDKHGICGKCSGGGQAPTPLSFVYFMTYIAPITPTGKVLTHRRWKRLKKQLDDFYENVPPFSHRLWNMQTQNSRFKAKKKNPKEGYIYLIKSENGYYKIGRSANVDRRLSQHEMDYPMKLRVIHSFQSSNVRHDEKRLLKAFERKQLRGEWFELDGYDVAWFRDIDDFTLSAALLGFNQRENVYEPYVDEKGTSLRKRISGLLGKIREGAGALRQKVG